MSNNRYKLWGLKFVVLLVVALPSLSNAYLSYFNRDLVEGLKQGHLYYFLLVNIVILLVAGKEILYIGYGVTSILGLSVVFMGCFVSFMKALVSNAAKISQSSIFAYSPHYLGLFVTLATMVPLAIAIFSVIPFLQYEKKVMTNRRSISLRKKILLIQTRVFAHIIFFVIPKIVSVIREEQHHLGSRVQTTSVSQDIVIEKGAKTIRRMYELLSDYSHIGITGIRLAVEYIPLWALEISQLPGKVENKK